MSDRVARGIVLVVEKVISREWTRSQVRALPHFLGDDTSAGEFRAVSFDIGVPLRGGMLGAVRAVDLRVEEGKPIHLVVRGRKWRVGDAIPPDRIVYRYEP